MSKDNVAVLGGGVAGLAAGYYLARRYLDVVIFEEQASPGGNCRTIERDGFLFDTGAHRFHDKNRAVTEDLRQLLQENVITVRAPSMIFDNNILLNFPIQPIDILGKMSLKFTLSAGLSLLKARLFSKVNSSFEDYAVNAYGELIAERFLLSYSSKLWGIPCSEMSKDIAGKRLKGINLGSLIATFLSKSASQNAHYEGEFLYPVSGIQKIAEELVSKIGRDRVLTGKRVTGVYGNNGRVTRVEINSDEIVDVDSVVSTLPLPALIAAMKHKVPENVLDVSASLRFRNVRLAAFALDKASVNECATMYFPDQKYIFTRIYEPRNRFIGMSPKGKTMLVAEVPCFSNDSIWQSAEEEFIDTVREQIQSTGMIEDHEIMAAYSVKLDKAYPVLENNYIEKTEMIINYLSSEFENLYLAGRNALFRYSWIHDLFIEGRLVAERVGSRSTV
jgi:protoporphyrinogen oxidase